MDSLKREIVGEVYRTLVLLGADNGLLGTVGSWGDGMSDADVLSSIRAWNDATLDEIKGRIGHYEKACPRPAYNQAEARGTAVGARSIY